MASNSTLGYKLSNLVGNDELKSDKAALVGITKSVAHGLKSAAYDGKSLRLNDKERSQMDALRAEAAALMKREDVAAAYFPYAAAFIKRADEVRNLKHHVVFFVGEDGEPGALREVLAAMAAELRDQAMFRPLRFGESAEMRVADAAQKVLAKYGLSSPEDPETIIAHAMFAGIDPEHPAAEAMAIKAAIDAVDTLSSAGAREEFELLSYMSARIRERMRVNQDAHAERERRAAFNPAADKGIFGGLKSVLASMAGNNAPPQWKRKNGFREVVAEAGNAE